MGTAFTLADGQLAAAEATVLGAANNERYVGVYLFNTSAQEQEVVLKVTRSGSTARTLLCGVLKKNEYCYVRGLPLDPSDVLTGYATSASSVDYLVTHSPEPFAVTFRDAQGAAKAPASVTVTTTEKYGLSRDGVVLAEILGEIRDLLLKIA